jgi:hypothetical protein
VTSPKLAVSTEWGRHYAHPGRPNTVPSVTTIKDMKAIKGLPYWAAREAATYAADNIAKLSALDRDEVIQLVKGSPWKPKPDSPSKVGDVVHDWIDRNARGETVPDDEIAGAPLQARQMWRQFGGFSDRYKPRWYATEFTVWSDEFGYAGTADWAAYIGEFLVLGDNKTGTGVYPDSAMQLAALSHADFILEPDGTEKTLPHFDKHAILHIRPRFSQLIPVDHISEWFRAFLGLKAVYDTVVNYEATTLLHAPKVEVRAA